MPGAAARTARELVGNRAQVAAHESELAGDELASAIAEGVDQVALVQVVVVAHGISRSRIKSASGMSASAQTRASSSALVARAAASPIPSAYQRSRPL